MTTISELVAGPSERPAVTFGDTTLTYAQLDERAGALARRLAGRGVGPGVLVAVFVERSVDMVVALLGITRAALTGAGWLAAAGQPLSLSPGRHSSPTTKPLLTQADFPDSRPRGWPRPSGMKMGRQGRRSRFIFRRVSAQAQRSSGPAGVAPSSGATVPVPAMVLMTPSTPTARTR